MDIFPMDLIAGVLLAVFIVISIIGILSFRYRRGIGPLLLLISGPIGSCSPVLWLLISMGTVDVTRALPIAVLVISLLILSIGLMKWRASDEG
ncbi:MAG: hypothetical protein U9R75_12820 [Candidatus Thermoplasmatota archaeon]|nr:hypothetical protein [Candidatus Thermoplasmatota archaeon]